jgi:pyruvate formate-lyase/glycerol dehydratase family glycyl radical enzyme
METMQQTSPSARILCLRKEIMGRRGSFITGVNPFIRAVALWKAASFQKSRTQIRAAYLHHLIEMAALEIEPEWRLAGVHLPTAHVGLEVPDPDNAEHLEKLVELGVAADEAKKVRRVVDMWQHHFCYAVGEPTDAFVNGVPWERPAADTDRVYWAVGMTENHSIRDYAKMIRLGFNGIRREVEALLAAADFADPEFPQKENFWKAVICICQAGSLLGQRYAALAGELAEKAESAAEASRLKEIQAVCARVPAEGATTFREAVQALWFGHILTCGEDGINANSLGRVDQILYPYYRADVDAGRISREEALELLEEFSCRMYLEYDVQAITLGGVDRDGNDAVNELSYLMLEATRNVELIRDLSIRIGKDTPAAFIELASELIIRGGGIPFIFNDDCFVKALTERGVAVEDARDYAPIGCVELTIPGRTFPHAVSASFCGAKCLELALFDGKDPRSGVQMGPQTGLLSSFTSFADLYAAYCQQVEFFAKQMVYFCNRGELVQREGIPLPLFSTLTDDCIPRGRDITDGGAVYNYHSVCFLGTANVADSLMALKKFVFEEKSIAAEEILAALRCNYEGYEPLRQRLLKQAPKYGNDIPEVDALAEQVATHFCATMDKMRSPLNGRYFVHLFSFLWNLDYGKYICATPDGRRADEPVAYSLSPQQGRDERGITALLNSLSHLPHKMAAAGSAAIVEIDPVVLKGDHGRELLSQLITSALAMGVGQLQWNVVTVERLLKAQENPEEYGNIAVRVAGYSQLFRLVHRELQDHIIARTKHQF